MVLGLEINYICQLKFGKAKSVQSRMQLHNLCARYDTSVLIDRMNTAVIAL